MRLSRRSALSMAMLTSIVVSTVAASLLPESEINVGVNGYSDSFGVDVFYPSITATKRIGGHGAVSGRYLVDAVTSASMQSRFEVDGITSATHTTHGGSSARFDEVRHEIGISGAQLFGRTLGSVDVLHSTEHDYVSTTLAATAARTFRRENVEIRLGAVRRWDQVSPVTRTWTRPKDVTSLDVSLTQTLHRRGVGQIDFTHTAMDGQLADVYQVVPVVESENQSVRLLEPRHPGHRSRNAIGTRTTWKVASDTSMELGYRRYWDSWGIGSDTVHGNLRQRFFGGSVILGLGLRYYSQGRAEFFRDSYDGTERYLTVDSKLDSSRSTEYQFRAVFAGSLVRGLGILDPDRSEVEAHVDLYERTTATPDWHSRREELRASLVSVGVRYRY
ncbi:MAG: DUF3570 domain-containing protein [Candidatus Eisenbacteria bacterium]